MRIISLFLLSTVSVLFGCTNTVKLEAPDKPIAVNVDVNIKHKIEIDRQLDKSITTKKDIF